MKDQAKWILVERRTGARRADLGLFVLAAKAGEVAERERIETGVEFDILPVMEGDDEVS